MRVAGRVIFTSDGRESIGNARRLHRMRRSFCKNWRNDKWRDLLLAFWFWLADGSTFVDIPVGEGEAPRLQLPPMSFEARFSVDTSDDAGGSDDDEGEDGDGPADDGTAEDEPDELDDDP